MSHSKARVLLWFVKRNFMTLEKNMGTVDRIIRPTLAAGIIAAYAAGKIKGKVAIGLLALSGIFIATSSVGWCPAYAATGIDTIVEE